MFNAQEFMQQSQTEQLDTKLPLVPIGEYPCIIDAEKLSVREQPNKEQGGEPYYILDVVFIIDSAVARDATGLPKPTVRESVFLDVTKDAAGNVTGLASGKGKNVQLGKLLDALGINDGGNPFQKLAGRPCMVRVIHKPDTKDPTNKGPYANVGSVGQLR